MGLEDRAMKEDEWFGIGIGGVTKVKNVAIGTEAAEDGGTRRGVNGLAE